MRTFAWTFAAIACILTTTASAAPATGDPAAVRRYVRDYGTAARVEGAAEIPSFSRQTGLACNVCHTSFPQLTAFGRDFKLNGYTMATQQKVEARDSSRAILQLNLIPPVSAMLITSVTGTRAAQPDAQNTNVDFPQELGLFIGGAVSTHIGGFIQITYDPAEASIAVDNVDLRLAYQTSLGSSSLTYGFTLNNSPAVQDVWNTTPAWGYPYTSSAVAPYPTAAALIDGGLGQQVAGLGGYVFWNNLLYGEFSAYRSAPQGAPNPPDASSEGTVRGFVPYWRVALQRTFGSHYLELGTYGLVATLYPTGVGGATNRFTDLALDAQYGVPVGGSTITAHATWIHERQQLDAAFADGSAANSTNTLQTFRADASFMTASRIGLTGGFVTIAGDSDTGLYPPDPVFGSRTGSPNSTGVIGELSVMPWLNTRIAVQYVMWTRFNGATDDYDASGRAAKDNNTLYGYVWMAF
ncbi:MAG: cytochrome C [Gemmatimonadales bacterium]|nr:cytochrome C [Gemmatimonadales bacterium]